MEVTGKTLRVEGSAPVSDSTFSKYSGIDTLSLQGALSVALGTAARASGITSVDVNTAGTTLRAEGFQAPLTLDAMSVNTGQVRLTGSVTQPNLFMVSSTGVLAQSFLTGGSRLDTLQVNAGSYLDSDFTNLDRLDVLTLNGGAQSQVTLGAEAENAGFRAVYGTDEGISITRTALSTNAISLVGGYGNDLFSLDNTGQLGQGNSIDGGGGGRDTLQVGTGTLTGALGDPAFRRITGIDVLSLGGGSNVTLGADAGNIGLSTVVAGASNVTLQADSMEEGVTLDASAVAGGRVFLSGSKPGSLFLLAGGDAFGSSTLHGRGENDTLRIIGSGGDLFGDAVFANKSGIESISLAGGNNRITLGGNAATALLNSSDPLLGATLFSGAAGGDTITQTAGGYYLDASAAASGVYFNIASPSLFSGNDDAPGTTILGSAKTDTLMIGAGDFSDTSIFGSDRIKDIEIVSFAGSTLGSAVTLDSAMEESFSTIVGSSGAMTFTQTEGSFLIDGREGSGNVFDLSADGSLLVDDTILGGVGVDSLFLGTASLEDDAFNNKSSIEYVSLTGASSIILGNAASLAGVSSLYGGEEGDSTIQVDAGAYYLNGADSTSNLFILSDASLLAENTIVGNDEADTLAVGDGEIIDGDFRNLSGVPVLSLGGNNHVTFGDIAASSGVSTILGGELDATVDLLSGSYEFKAGEGSFFLKAADSALMSVNTFTGNGENSTLAFEMGEIEDDAFTYVSEVGSVLLEGSSLIILGGEAAEAGIATVFGGDGDSTFNQTEGSYWLDGSASSSNLFDLASGSLAADNTIVGGGGEDTLAFTGEDLLIDDDAFANVSDVEVLSLSGRSSVTLGENADTAEFKSVITGDGDSVINIIDGGPDEILIDGSASEALRVNLDSIDLLGNSTLFGGEGVDTLSIGGDSEIEDEAFASVFDFEVLSLADSSISLGGNATNSFSTILGGDGDSTITVGGEDSNISQLLIDAQGGNDLIILDNLALGNNTILGGGGTDTLQVEGNEILDDFFENHDSLEVLQISGASHVVLGDNAMKAGIEEVEVDVNTADSLVLYAADFGRSLMVDGSQSSGGINFTGSKKSDTLRGGSGADTLQGWATTTISTSDTLNGGDGADLFVLGDEVGNGYGTSGSKALISDFAGGTDYLQLKDYGSGASSYRVDANTGSGYTHQLFDISGGGSGLLLANINYSGGNGTNAQDDLLGTKAIFL